MLGDLRHRAGHGHFPSTLMGPRKPVGYPPAFKKEGMFSDQCVTGWPRTDKEDIVRATSCSNLADCQCAFKRKPSHEAGSRFHLESVL